MTKSRPAGGSRTLVGLLSTFALVGGVVGFQNAAAAQEATSMVTLRALDLTPEVPTPATVPEAVPAPAPVEAAPAPVFEAPAPAPAPVVEAPAPAPAPPSGTTGGSGG